MKRFALFLGIFASLISLLLLVLGPDEILREYESAEFAEEEITEPVVTLPAPDKSGVIGLGLTNTTVEGPLLEKKVLLEDGRVVKVPTVWMEARVAEHRADEWLFAFPRIRLYPGLAVDESPQARIAARTARAQGQGLVDFSDRRPDLRELALAGQVEGTWYNAQGDPLFQLLGEELQFLIGSEEPEEETGESHYFLQNILSHQKIQLWRADQALRVEGGGFVLDPVRQRLTLQPPVLVRGTDFSLPDEGNTADPQERQPLEVLADGQLVFQQRESSLPEAAASDATQQQGGLGVPLDLLQDGILTCQRNVRIRQDDRWLQTELVRIDVARALVNGEAKPQVREFLAGDGVMHVDFGLLGGKGSARRIHYVRSDNLVTLDGPLFLEELQLSASADSEEGGESSTLTLRAEEKLLVFLPDPEDDSRPRKLRWRVSGNARLHISGQLQAEGGVLEATVWVDPEAATPYRLDTLDLTGAARVVVVGLEDSAPEAQADHIRVVQVSEDHYELTLNGSARLTDSRGQLVGPQMQLSFQVGGDAPEFSIDVPQLTSGRFQIPGMLLKLPTSASEPRPAPASSVLLVHPVGVCSYHGESTSHVLTGRARYEVLQDEALAQTLDCDQLRVRMVKEAYDFFLEGDVVLNDLDGGSELNADSLELVGDILTALGTPTRAKLPLEEGQQVTIFADFLQLGTEDQRLLARGGSARQARLELPDKMFSGEPEPEADLPAAPTPVVLWADQIDLRPGDRDDASAALERLEAAGSLRLERARDGLHMVADRLVLEPNLGRMVLRGSEAQPATIRRRTEHAPDRQHLLQASWLEFLDHGHRIGLAKNSQMVFHWPRDKRVPDPEEMMEITLQPGNETWLDGNRLFFSGGVETTVTYKDEILESFSERLELLLDQPLEINVLDDRSVLVQKVQPVRINAQQEVQLRHPTGTCSGALLSYDFISGKGRLKAGAEPCMLVLESSLGRTSTPGAQFQQWDFFFPMDREWLNSALARARTP
jgi:hypothetical protein